MLDKLRSLFKEEKGTVLLLASLAMIAFIGFTALVTDAGTLYLNHIKLVNALDSAVLAGAQDLPQNPNTALTNAANFAANNGIDTGQASFQITDSNKTVYGTANRQVGLFFAKMFGYSEGQVNAVAKAHITPVTAVNNGIRPFGVIKEETDFQFGQQVVLKAGAGSGNPYRGWFGPLSLGANGASIYSDNLKYGYNGKIKVGDTFWTEDGNMSQPTKTAINYIVSQCHDGCTPSSFDKDCPKILILPVVSIASDNPAGYVFEVKVEGFAAFMVDSFVGNGNDNWVKGAFINYVEPGDNCDSDDSGEDFGMYNVKLIE